jgi:hypothetical protein
MTNRPIWLSPKGVGTEWVVVPIGPDNRAACVHPCSAGAHLPAQTPLRGAFSASELGPPFTTPEHLELKASIRKFPRRLSAQVTVGGITGLLYVVTPFWPDWIEAVSGWDPDQHKGSFEWLIVLFLLVSLATLDGLP